MYGRQICLNWPQGGLRVNGKTVGWIVCYWVSSVFPWAEGMHNGHWWTHCTLTKHHIITLVPIPGTIQNAVLYCCLPRRVPFRNVCGYVGTCIFLPWSICAALKRRKIHNTLTNDSSWRANPLVFGRSADAAAEIFLVNMSAMNYFRELRFGKNTQTATAAGVI